MSSIRSEQEKAKIFEDFKAWYEDSGIKRLGFTVNPEMNPTPEDVMLAIMKSEQAIREGRFTRRFEVGDRPEYPEELRTRTRFDDENPDDEWQETRTRFDNE